ncbi:HD domain-containing protein [Andreprevotia lacus DSM 23236]|jgi:(p)ppGpp synthase/HD superfamily hydrolase|uniref:HD domain-containing protein n=1 Tax=Andreprevotia lacus DSM 23236 TaxID=1121001 RepID=A0A1W1XBS0_9NEIS|nr:HD domain-containing protein [Andreprevotia lacus]SMC21396.1 HD domain-containing protein [Andreprevotia lacus DSM 23236]
MHWSIDRYAQAWHFATLHHMGQTYGGTRPDERIPYINHIASVAAEVLWGCGQDSGLDVDLALQCALLHDVVEDTPATVEELAQTFGPAVAAGVLALTKNEQLPTKQEQMADSLQRILQQPREIALVKLADRITNLYHPPYYWSDEKIAQYRIEASLILDALGHASTPLAARLTDKIAAYGQA